MTARQYEGIGVFVMLIVATVIVAIVAAMLR